jgi:N-acetylglucosaminyldiphosphoundecaprenol N-acetyl-beta-D-mannosaminyltransferase
MDEALEFIDDSIQKGGFHQIATANVDFVKHAIDNADMQQILFDCDLVVPDGMPLLWVSKLLNCPLKERVCGVDLVPRLAELAARKGYRVFLLGAKESTSRMAAENLVQMYPDLEICGRYSPPLTPLEDMDHEFILRKIEAARPDILLVAFGNPKQERWLSMHRSRLSVPACIGVGGTLDFIAGSIPRAPEWMRELGLEWFYRCSQEPLRLTGRYVSDAAALCMHVPRQFVPHALQSRCRSTSQVLAQETEGTILISVYGDLQGSTLKEFVAIADSAVQTGLNIIVNLTSTICLGIDALGEFVRLGSQLMDSQRLFLAGLRPHHLRVLRGAKLKRLTTVSNVRDAMERSLRARQRHSRGNPRHRVGDQPAPAGVRLEFVRLFDICLRLAAANQAMHESLALRTRVVRS